jgi:hypothetical protein
VDEPLYRYRLHGRSLTSDRVAKLRDRVRILEDVGRSGAMTDNERAALTRSLTVQRRELRLTEAEAAIRAGSADARALALAAARTRGVPLRSRAAALVATLAPRAAARALEHRDQRGGPSRLRRSFP